MRAPKHLAASLAITATLALGAGSAFAEPIMPGFDLFETVSPGTSAVTPFGVVEFRGVPFPAVNNLGSTDTIVQRTGGLPPGGTGPIPIELVALHLVSVNPVNVPNVGPVDMHATINKGGIITGLPQPDSLPPSTGTLLIASHVDVGPGQGTFDSFFDVFVNILLTPPGGDPSDPAQVLGTQVFNEGQLRASGVPWSATAPLGYPSNPAFPSGMFFPSITFTEAGPLAFHTVSTPTNGVPEPSALALLGCALAAFGATAWRRQRRAPHRWRN